MLPHERTQQHTAIQIVHVPVPQIQKQSAVTDLLNSQFSITAVEASQVVGSFSLSEEFDALADVTTLKTSSTSTSISAPVRDVAHATPAPEIDVPMHNNVGQELIPTTVQKPMIDDIFGKLDTMIDALSPLDCLTDLVLRMETVVAEVENASVVALRTNASLLPDPKRRKIFPMPRIPEEVRDELLDVDSVRDGNLGGCLASPCPSWVPPDISPACQATGRASCATHDARYLSFSFCLSQRKTAYPSFPCSPCIWRSRRPWSSTP